MFGGVFLFYYIYRMSKVKSEIDSFISRVIPQAKKELKMILDQDWSQISSMNHREEEFKLQNMLTSRAMGYMKKLYIMADKSGDLNRKKVKSALGTLREYFTIMDQRFTIYNSDDSWMNVEDMDDARALSRREFEIEFQSKILGSINDYEKILRDINDGEEDDTVSIRLHANSVFPLAMQKLAIEKYPEVQKALDNLKNPEEDEDELD